MKYKVLREHIGQERYVAGDERELEPRQAAQLIANGVLEDPEVTAQSGGDIPDDWTKLTAKPMIELANKMGGEGIKNKQDARAFIELKLEEQTLEPKLEIVEKDDQWAIVKGDEQVGEPFDTKEAAEAALAELTKE